MIIIGLIIASILYLIMIYSVLSLYYTYRKDIEELENRFLVIEKRINECETTKDKNKEGDNKEMACKGKRKR